MSEDIKYIQIECPSFDKDGRIPQKHTGFGEDISPEIRIEGLNSDVKYLAVIMDDLDVPIVESLNHWLIWNIPYTDCITENIPYGAETVNGAIQGIGYGKHRYRGPKQPPFIKKEHRYRFTVYALDSGLDLAADARKEDLLKAMSGHILQSGTLTGVYKP